MPSSRSARNSRILFLYLPNYHEQARLETMPFAYSAVKVLAADGARFSLCLWERRLSPYSWLQNHHNARLHFIRRGPAGPLPRNFFLHKYRWLAGLILTAGARFDLIIAVGPKALIFGACLKRFFGGRLVFFNDELPSWFWSDQQLEREEKAAAPQIDLLISPDTSRIAPALADLGLPANHPALAFPNAPQLNLCPANFDWQRLGVPPGHQVILHAGSVADWAQVPEILFVAGDLPARAVVVIHSRSSHDADAYRKSVAHLHTTGRVFWSTESVSEEELGSMIASSLCTLGLYRNAGPNFEQMGMSSGKIMRSISIGVPVIANRFDSMRFIEDHGLGVLVNHPREIPLAVANIAAHAETMRNNCIAFSREHLDMRKHVERLWTRLDELENAKGAVVATQGS